jgi:hypothetical protein
MSDELMMDNATKNSDIIILTISLLYHIFFYLPVHDGSWGD